MQKILKLCSFRSKPHQKMFNRTVLIAFRISRVFLGGLFWGSMSKSLNRHNFRNNGAIGMKLGQHT